MEPDEDFPIPGVPQFTYQVGAKIEFPLLLKNSRKKNVDHDEWKEEEEEEEEEEEDASSGSEKDHSQCAKAASPVQQTQGENKNEDAR